MRWRLIRCWIRAAAAPAIAIARRKREDFVRANVHSRSTVAALHTGYWNCPRPSTCAKMARRSSLGNRSRNNNYSEGSVDNRSVRSRDALTCAVAFSDTCSVFPTRRRCERSGARSARAKMQSFLESSRDFSGERVRWSREVAPKSIVRLE